MFVIHYIRAIGMSVLKVKLITGTFIHKYQPCDIK